MTKQPPLAVGLAEAFAAPYRHALVRHARELEQARVAQLMLAALYRARDAVPADKQIAHAIAEAESVGVTVRRNE